jgi:hypothetical protein
MENPVRSKFFYLLLLVLLALTGTVFTLGISGYDSACAVANQAADQAASARNLDEFDHSFTGNIASGKSAPSDPAVKADSLISTARLADPSSASESMLPSGQVALDLVNDDVLILKQQSLPTDNGLSLKSETDDLPASEVEVGLQVSGPEGSELIIPVPPGAKVPALFLDETPRPVPQQKLLDGMAAEFNEAVSNPPPGVSVEDVWEKARLNADEKYLKFFGYAAYNAYHLQAAKEAAREKKGMQGAQPPKQ